MEKVRERNGKVIVVEKVEETTEVIEVDPYSAPEAVQERIIEDKEVPIDAKINDMNGLADYIEKNPYLMSDSDRVKIREAIQIGEIGEKDIREIGAPLRERYNEIHEEGDNALQQISDERTELVRQGTYSKDAESLEIIRQDFADLRERENEIRMSLTPAETMKKVLSETRETGPAENDAGQLYADDSAKNVIIALDKTREGLPTDWIERSNDETIKAKQALRGYFMHDGETSTIALSGGRGMNRCAYHEMGHHIENLYPEIKKLEHEFYNRRTEGEKLRWLGLGYSLNEKTRYDNFVDPYMGKDYGNREDSGYEVLSMGMEGMYTGSYDMKKDPEYQDFIFGILSSI